MPGLVVEWGLVAGLDSIYTASYVSSYWSYNMLVVIAFYFGIFVQNMIFLISSKIICIFCCVSVCCLFVSFGFFSVAIFIFFSVLTGSETGFFYLS